MGHARLPVRELPFAERIAARSERVRSRLVVGLDPVLERLPGGLGELEPEQGLERFSREVLEAVAEHVVAVKPQVAFFERHGWRGGRALQEVLMTAARLELPVILDAKRGDIGHTARAYAEALLGDDPASPGPYVDAVTLNPYLGADSVGPFLERARAGKRGVFILARTSNPSAGEFQDLGGEEPLYLEVARAAHRWGEGDVGASGYGPVGLVVGATCPEKLAGVRGAAPHALLLLPGVGAQGARIDALAPAFDARGGGALVPVSRSILYAHEETEGPWQEAVAAAADRARAAIEGALVSR